MSLCLTSNWTKCIFMDFIFRCLPPSVGILFLFLVLKYCTNCKYLLITESHMFACLSFPLLCCSLFTGIQSLVSRFLYLYIHLCQILPQYANDIFHTPYRKLYKKIWLLLLLLSSQFLASFYSWFSKFWILIRNLFNSLWLCTVVFVKIPFRLCMLLWLFLFSQFPFHCRIQYKWNETNAKWKGQSTNLFPL